MSEEVKSPSPSAEAQADASQEPQEENSESSEKEELASSEEAKDSSEEKVGKKTEEATKKIEKKLRKLKLKVDQKEEEVEFDPDDDEFLTKQFQMAKAYSKRTQEHSSLQKEVAAFVEELRKNPKAILSDPNIGIDLKTFAKEIIEQEIENAKKSPEQLEKEKLESELKRLQDERKKEQEDFKTREFERLQTQEYERYDVQISSALAKSELPKTPYTVKKIADYMLLGLQQGIDVSPEDVLPLVKQEMTNDLKEMFATMPDEVIENLVGKDTIGRLRKKNLANAKAKPPVPVSKSIQDAGEGKKQDENVPKKSYKSFFGV